MKFMRAMLWVMLCGAAIGFAFTFAMESSFEGRAQKVQIVRIDKTRHSRFGPVTIDVGNPEMLIVDDPSAFLKNKTATGLPMVNADTIKAHGGDALQLQAMLSVIGLARIGCALSLLAVTTGLVLLNRILCPIPPPGVE